ncbi:hypothetical protein PIB30_054286 [Stylosanthes scabra]|uniref:Uncharacterized protein n=1 Tax=Stylosanthes scabra TaxID=79078 RepID=A0ABU6WIN3_9FABA|nr:hypothetical protein [Stylosanthes scabra]
MLSPSRSIQLKMSWREVPSAITSIEEVMNLTDPTSCWILAKIISVEGGPTSWCYLSCHCCFKKVMEVKNGYQCIKCKRIILDPTFRWD